MTLPKPLLQTVFLESLEPRIAPAGLAGADDPVKQVVLGNPQLLTAGQILSTADAAGAYLLRVDKGQAMVFTTDLNGNNVFDVNEITGIAAGDGLRMTIFADINGDIVTNLRPNGLLTDSDFRVSLEERSAGGDGKILLNSRIEALTLRSVTDADLTPKDRQAGLTADDRLVLSSYSIHGNILAGGGVGVPGGGIVIDTSGLQAQVNKFGTTASSYQVDTILPTIGSIRTGSAAASSPSPEAPFGQFFSFGYRTIGADGERGDLLAANNDFVTRPGYLLPFVPGIGQSGGDIIGLQPGVIDPRTGDYVNLKPFRIDAIITGDGGIGARGGDIVNVVLYGDSGGLRVLAGDGGSGPNGGRGGSVVNLQDLGSTNGIVEIRSGDGGDGLIGKAGAAGAVSFGRFEMNGEIYIGLGSGGSGFTSSGAGTSLLSANLQPTDTNPSGANLTPTAVSVVSSYRPIGQIATQSLVDFNQDGFSDLIYLTHSPDQVIMKFGSPAGITETSPTLHFASPAFSPLTGSGARSSGLVVQDFNGDGWLDFAVGSSVENSYGGIRTFLNPGDAFRPNPPFPPLNPPAPYNGWFELADAGGGRNYIDSYVLSPVPFLNTYSQGFDVQQSGMPLTDMVAGNFNGDADRRPDIAVVLQTWKSATVSADRPNLALLMMTGTGDGRFFADFDFARESQAGNNTQQKMPLLNGNAFANLSNIAGHHAVALRSTASVIGDPTEIIVAAVLKNGEDRRIQSLQFGPTVFPGYSAFQEQFLTGFAPSATYYEPRFDDNGNIEGYNTRDGIPLDVTIADLGDNPLNVGSNPPQDGVYDIIVLNQDNALSVVTPVYGYSVGIALKGRQDQSVDVIASDGSTITQGPQPVFGSGDNVQFVGIIAGDFTSWSGVASQFALYSLTPDGAWRGMYSLSLPGLILDNSLPPAPPLTGNLGGGASLLSLAFAGSAVTPDPSVYFNGEMIAFDLFAASSTSSVFGFVVARPVTALNSGFLGSFAFGGAGLTPPIGFGLYNNAIQLVAGNGGDSFFGSGGAGGSIGTGKIQPPITANTPPIGAFSVVLPNNEYLQPNLNYIAGSGGSGFVNGGSGGGIRGLVVSFEPATTQAAVVRLTGGEGGNALIGRGGDGGGITEVSIERGAVFAGGDAGRGFTGGNGGSITGSGGRVYGPDSTGISLIILAGAGGQGIAAGGLGGSIASFVAEYRPPIGGGGGSLSYTAGRGGNAVSGAGGVGGSIRDSSPAFLTNNLVGDVVLAAGDGGRGLAGGAGGSILNFINRPTEGDDTPNVVSAVAGHGGNGITRSGGAGGSISNFTASGQAFEELLDRQFSRVLAGDGGDSFGSTGGRGGDLLGVTTTAGGSSVAAVAGDGGAGLLVGGQGGSVRDSSLDATDTDALAAKVIVFAGHGGDAYAARASAPGVALPPGPESEKTLALRAFGGANGVGGQGGSIINFRQPTGVQTAVDLVAGNGGSLINYGSIEDGVKTAVGKGGSISGVKLTGEAGRIDETTPIKSYAPDFVDRVLVNGWGTLLKDSLGNVGVVAGEAGHVKDGVAGDGLAKNGSVSNFAARGIMSMVAGSVDRVALINTISGITTTSGTGVLGAWKDLPLSHPSNTRLYFDANGVAQPLGAALVSGGRLMDGALFAFKNPDNLTGLRVFAG